MYPFSNTTDTINNTDTNNNNNTTVLLKVNRWSVFTVSLILSCVSIVLVAISEEVANDYYPNHINDKIVLRFILIGLGIGGEILSLIGLFGSYYGRRGLLLATSFLTTLATFVGFGLATHYRSLFILWLVTCLDIALSLSAHLLTVLLFLNTTTSGSGSSSSSSSNSSSNTSLTNVEPTVHYSGGVGSKLLAAYNQPPAYEPPPHYSQLYLNVVSNGDGCGGSGGELEVYLDSSSGGDSGSGSDGVYTPQQFNTISNVYRI
ncbi:uncharacterized protein LOC128956839 [Oppia nitens]|uniref:uncharacterized protein LOC128956839 n=1 Tax=Oppia nitens TaxID=1686743 RepID=UPI0023DA3416|nr:uncharacterized protein LOC128956839 [Oppia nitens]